MAENGPAPSSTEPPPAMRLVAVLALAGITVSLMQTLIIPLVPILPRLIGASAADTSWAITATLLAGAVSTPVMGRLADMFGKRRMLLVCLVVLVVGSVIGALATSLIPLVVGRALQGLAAGVVPLGISLMRDQLPPERLASATALMSASLGVGGALGLPLASVFAQYADWHMLFWAAGGMGALVTVLVLTLVRESPQRAGGRFDLIGAVGITIALLCLLLAVSKGGAWGWTSGLTLGLLVVAVVVLLAWGWWELRCAHPLVDLRVSRRRQVLLTNFASVMFGFSMFAMSLALPQLLQLPAETGYGLGQTILVAGLVLAPGGLVMMAISPVSARITATSGPRTTLMVGAVIAAIGYGGGIALHDTVWEVAVVSAVIAAGVGLAFGALPTLVMSAVPRDQTAAANGLNNLMRSVGTSSASAVSGVILAELTIPLGPAQVPSEDGFQLVLGIGALAALAAFVFAVFIPRKQAAAPTRPEPTAPPGSARAESAQVEPVPAPIQQLAVVPAPSPTVPPLAAGVVRYGGTPVQDAVLTVVGQDGRELGVARTDVDGVYSIPRRRDGRPQVLVVQWLGTAHAEFLTGDRPAVYDIELDRTAVPVTAGGPSPNGRPSHEGWGVFE